MNEIALIDTSEGPRGGGAAGRAGWLGAGRGLTHAQPVPVDPVDPRRNEEAEEPLA